MVESSPIYDVIVVGAGPAGSTCAASCAKMGLNVALLEKEKQAGDASVCGGLLPAVVFDEFDIPPELISRKINGFKAYSPSGNKVLMHFSTKGATTERSRFDKMLADKSVRQGAKLFTSTKAVSTVIQENHVKVISISKGEKIDFIGKIIVIANGPKSSLVEGIFGKIYDGLRFEIAIQKYYPLAENQDYSFFEAYHDPLLGYGLGWLSPLKDYAVVGAGIPLEEGRLLKKKFEEFITHYDIPKKIDSKKCLKVEGAVIPFDNFPKKLYSKRVLVVGDAAMLCNPFSGDGVYYAMKSGVFAAEVIVKAINSGDFSESRFARYQKQLEENFREQFKICLSMQKQTYGSHKFAEKSLTNADSDFINFLERVIWTKKTKKLSLKDKWSLLIGMIKTKLG